MWIRALVVAVLAFLIGYAVRDLIRANPQLFGRGPGKNGRRKSPPHPDRSETRDDEPAGRVLSFRRPPHTVLGVPADATVEDAHAAWERARAENDPARLEGMSSDLKALAEVRCKELDEAWAAFQASRD